ncbi:putative cysteine desulfurase [Morella rubra]|uniref:Putative cysteine desulfurase n=1 Tax=Morella rubra TaxID=262757 RepID=A0A6A1VCL8_9ROSI|nr:putative cysteine desulfurase [Morella rubra]
MEFEQLVLGEAFSTAQKTKQDHNKASTASANASISSNDLPHRSDSSRILEMGLPRHESAETKLSWLRSQIIGGEAEMDTPFGKRRLTYADHTASGRSLRYVEDLIMKNVLPSYGNSHTSDSYVGHRTTKMVHEAAKYIKKCLGGGEDDAIIFCGSGTTAAIKRLQEVMGLAVPSIMRDRVLKCLSVEERWVVFVGPYEHHSNLLSWRQSLAEVVEIGLDANGSIDMEALRQELKRYKRANRPILGSFSACSNVTGIYSDTRAIARLLHQNGGFACFDFAASGPYVKIDMRSGEIDGYDAIFLSPHKFIGGPGTPGVLLMNKILYRLKSSPPSTCGGGTVIYVNGFNERDTLYYEDIEERENGGTPQIIQTVRAALTFWVKEHIGYEVIEKYEHAYIEKALERLLPNRNICVLGNTSLKRQAVLSFLVYSTSNSSSAALKKGSNTDSQRDKRGIAARGGCACAGPYAHSLLNVDEAHSLAFRDAFLKGYQGVKPGWTRISFPYYMSEEEFEFILAALEFVSIYGQRFLSLYHFDWRTGSWAFKKKELKQLLEKDNNGNVHISPLAIASRAGNHEHYRPNASDDEEARQIKTIKKYTTYLEGAKYVASLLPKFPLQRRAPEDIDVNLVSFRV